MLWIKGAVLFRRGQYCTGILLPSADLYWYNIAPPPPPGRNQGRQYYTAKPVMPESYIFDQDVPLSVTGFEKIILLFHSGNFDNQAWRFISSIEIYDLYRQVITKIVHNFITQSFICDTIEEYCFVIKSKRICQEIDQFSHCVRSQDKHSCPSINLEPPGQNTNI